jgi:hypothetical protein
MKIRGSTLLRTSRLHWLLFLVLSFSSTGCRSFLRNQAMKDYPVKTRPVEGFTAPNRYQEDFLYLKTLAEEVVPLQDRYFPPDKRAAMEQEILTHLGQPDCSHETFLMSVERYLGAFHCQHACVVENPRPLNFTALYPFRIHYVSNDLYVSNIGREYDRSLIGQKIMAINDQPVSEVEQKLISFVSAESPWTKRTSLELPPFPYSRPDFYRIIGLSPSVSNSLKLEFAGHPAVAIAPSWKEDLQWQRGPRPPHPITGRTDHQYDCQIFPEQNFAYLQFNACFDKTAILDGLNMVRPWVRPLVRAWLGVQFHRKKPFDVLRGIYDPARPVFKDYLASAIQDVNRRGITNLILDLRYNGGGETELVKQLVYHLTRRDDLNDSRGFEYNLEAFAYYDPKGFREFRSWYLKTFGSEPKSKQLLPAKESPFFARITDPESPYYVAPDRPVFSGNIIVLANQNTGSAASILTGLIQDNRLAVIVGTTTANNPTGPTGMTPFKLPHSGIMISLPTEYDERALPSNGDILQPDYWVEDSMGDLQAGRDAAFEKALELWDLSQTKAGPLLDEDIQGAIEFLKALKAAGRQPGWSKHDKGEAALEAYSYFAPKSVTFNIRKHGETPGYHYTLVRKSKEADWELQHAWRTDRKGRTIEKYTIPNHAEVGRSQDDGH